MSEPASQSGVATAQRIRPLAGGVIGDTIDVVVLRVGSEWYGLDARQVVEVQPLSGLARVPGVPPPWTGVLNIRGTLCPLLDLRRYLRLPEPDGHCGRRKVAVVEGAGLTVGLVVEDAAGIRQIAVSQIGLPLAGMDDAPGGLVRGVTPDLLTVLDAEALLADARLMVGEVAR